ncbi:unnamed protein product, partial [Mesorhabditis spiculigera]
MILRLQHFIYIFFGLPTLAKAETSELILSRFKGLAKWMIAGEGSNEHYKLTFCACYSPVINPSTSRDCECSPELEGKSAMESTHLISYSAACTRSYNPRKCLNAKFNRKGNYYYVRVKLAGAAVTNPVWQNIKNSHYKTAEVLTATDKGHLDISYQILNGGDDERSTRVFEKTQQISKWKPRKTYTTRPPTTSYPLATLSSRGSSSVSRLNTIDAIRFFLLREGVRSGTPAHVFDIRAFKERMVIHHNAYRAKHGCSSLNRDSALDAAAQRYADRLAATQDCLKHEKPKNYGENLFFYGGHKIVSPDMFAEAVTQCFYQEGINYNYNRFTPNLYHKVGHFTQLIWRSTTRMGVGIAIKTSTGRGRCVRSSGLPLVYVVVKYDPMGNMQSYSEYMENVVPPIFRRIA